MDSESAIEEFDRGEDIDSLCLSLVPNEALAVFMEAKGLQAAVAVHTTFASF